MFKWLQNVVTFYNKYRKWLLPVLGVLIFIGGMFAGQRAMPEKVVFKEIEIEKEVVKVVVQEVVVEKKVYIQAKKEKTRKETTTTKTPDGTETTKTVEETQTDTDTQENQEKVTEKVVYQEKIVEKLVEKEKLVMAKVANWNISGGIGVSIPTFLGKEAMGVPGLNGAVIQLEVDRRVIGPFSMGVFGNTQGTVGLTLSGQF